MSLDSGQLSFTGAPPHKGVWLLPSARRAYWNVFRLESEMHCKHLGLGVYVYTLETRPNGPAGEMARVPHRKHDVGDVFQKMSAHSSTGF